MKYLLLLLLVTVTTLSQAQKKKTVTKKKSVTQGYQPSQDFYLTLRYEEHTDTTFGTFTYSAASGKVEVHGCIVEIEVWQYTDTVGRAAATRSTGTGSVRVLVGTVPLVNTTGVWRVLNKDFVFRPDPLTGSIKKPEVFN